MSKSQYARAYQQLMLSAGNMSSRSAPSDEASGVEECPPPIELPPTPPTPPHPLSTPSGRRQLEERRKIVRKACKSAASGKSRAQDEVAPSVNRRTYIEYRVKHCFVSDVQTWMHHAFKDDKI